MDNPAYRRSPRNTPRQTWLGGEFIQDSQQFIFAEIAAVRGIGAVRGIIHLVRFHEQMATPDSRTKSSTIVLSCAEKLGESAVTDKARLPIARCAAHAK